MSTEAPAESVCVLIIRRRLSDYGGTRHLKVVMDHWAERGNDVWLATYDRAGQHAPPIHPEINSVVIERPARVRSRSVSSLVVALKLRRLIRSLSPNVVVCWGTSVNFLGPLAAFGAGVPVVISEVADLRELPGSRARRALRRLGYRRRRAHAVVVQTQDLADWFGRFVDPARVHVIPSPVRAANHHRPPGGMRSGQIVAIGRLAVVKGFDLLLRAFAESARTRPGWRLRILGEGAQRPHLEELVRSLGIADRVELPGYAADPDLELARADLFVMSSRTEGFPLALTEALVCGVPVVAFACPTGPSEIVRHGVDGLLVPPRDVRALAVAMGRLMDDSRLREALAARAPEVVVRFDRDRTLAAWDGLIESASRGRRLK